MNPSQPFQIPVDITASPRVIRVARIIAQALNEVADVLEDPSLAPIVEVPAAEGKPQTATDAPSSAGAESSTTAPAAAPASTTTSSETAPPAPASPQTTAETAPADAAPAHAPAVELDARGLPWDARIHSSSRAKLKNLEWKLVRGVDPALVATVEAELRAVMAPAPSATAATNPDAENLDTAAIFGGGAAPVAPVAPVAPAAPAAPVAPAAPAAYSAEDVFPRVTKYFATGAVTKPEVDKLLAELGIAALPLIMARTDVIPTFIERLDALAASKNVGGA